MLSSAMYANEKLMRIVWNGVTQAIAAYNANIELPDPEIIRKAIDTSDTDLAKKLIAKYKISIVE